MEEIEEDNGKRRYVDTWPGYVKANWPVLTACFCIVAAFLKVQFDQAALDKRVTEISAKYIPVIELSEHRITILEENQKFMVETQRQILEGSRRIEHNLADIEDSYNLKKGR